MADQEGTRKRGDYQVVSNAPDVCKTPSGPSMVPVPYQIIATFSPVVGTTPTVRFTGEEVFTLRSRIMQVKGDEPGVGGGVRSSTFAPSGVCEPITSSTTVRAEQSPVVRNDDIFKMNTGNTIGKAVVPGGGGGSSVGPSGKIEGDPNPPKAILSKQEEAARQGKGVLGQIGGFFKGAGGALWDMGKGIVSLGVGAAKLSPLSQAAEDSSKATGLFDYRGYSETSEALRNTAKAIYNDPGAVLDGITKPYEDAVARGDYGEALGRGVVDIGSFFIPGAGAAGKAGGAANAAGHVGQVGRLGEAANVAGHIGEAGRLGEVAGAAGKVGEAANVAGHVGEAGRLGEATGAAGKVGEAADVARATQATKAGEATVDAAKAADATKVAEDSAKAGEVAKGEAAANAGRDGVKVESAGKRPSWRQSEKDVGQRVGEGYSEQKSFKNGQEVPYGTEGSTRPDWYKPGSSVEVKNYNIQTLEGQERLIDNVTNQAIERAKHVPEGTVQSLFIDVRGQQVGRSTLENIVDRIHAGSNGVIKPENITILR